jgi:multiple sugar transport system permease protein
LGGVDIPFSLQHRLNFTMLQKLQNSRNALGLLFMLPAAILLVLFLTYPLILGIWLGFTDTKIGREGVWVGGICQ